MKIAYFDCFSGLSGDMIIGALIDLGVSLSQIESELAKIELPECRLAAEKTSRNFIQATKFLVRVSEKKTVRTWANIKELIEESSLDEEIKGKTLSIFSLLAEAEAKIHGKSIEQIHFHEVGVIDTIIDVVGAVVGLKLLEVQEVYCSPIATGVGLTKTEHGLMPIPAPATLEILKGTAVYSAGIPAELTTPTGAAIIKEIAKNFGDLPPLTIEKIGYGAGSRQLEIPNVLRVIIGQPIKKIKSKVTLFETNLDSIDSETLGYTMDRLLDAGALDVWFSPIYMKKNRPAYQLSVLADKERETEIAQIIFEETGTLGIRTTAANRLLASRSKITVETEFGPVSVKVGLFKGRMISLGPEFEDCRKLATRTGVSLKKIYFAAQKAATEFISKQEKK
jgi:hypothetical protein